MKNTIIRRFKFDAMHRIVGHEGQCRAFHGHEYHVEVHLVPQVGLDALGRVMDFSVVKSILGDWIDNNVDHTGIFAKNDDSAATHEIIEFNKLVGKPCVILDVQPTAENIAMHLLTVFTRLLEDHPVLVTKVVLQETTNCRAEACHA